MKKNVYAIILQFLTITVWPLFMVSLLLYLTSLPFVDIEQAFLQISDGVEQGFVLNTDHTLMFSLLFIVFSYLGYAVTALLAMLNKKMQKIRQQSRLISGKKTNEATGFATGVDYMFQGLVLLIAVIAAATFVLPYLPSPIALCCLAPCVISYVAACRQFNRSYIEAFSSAWMVLCIVLPTLATMFMSAFNLDYPVQNLAIIFLAQFSVSLLARSQGNIDFMMERRRHRFEHLPPSIRRYVFTLSAVFIALLFSSLLFWDGILYVFGIIGQILYLLLRLIVSLLPTTAEEEQSQPEAAQPPAEDSALLIEENPYAELIDLISLLILSAAAIIFIYRNRKRIFAMLEHAIIWLKRLIEKLLRPTPIYAMLKDPTSKYYVDYEITLTPSTEGTRRQKKMTIREWKRRYARFLKQPAGTDSYREGYRLTLIWLTIQGVTLSDAETPTEILHNAKRILSGEEWAQITECYNRVRYSEAPTLTHHELKTLTASMAMFLDKK